MAVLTKTYKLNELEDIFSDLRIAGGSSSRPLGSLCISAPNSSGFQTIYNLDGTLNSLYNVPNYQGSVTVFNVGANNYVVSSWNTNSSYIASTNVCYTNRDVFVDSFSAVYFPLISMALFIFILIFIYHLIIKRLMP